MAQLFAGPGKQTRRARKQLCRHARCCPSCCWIPAALVARLGPRDALAQAFFAAQIVLFQTERLQELEWSWRVSVAVQNCNLCRAALRQAAEACRSFS